MNDKLRHLLIGKRNYGMQDLLSMKLLDWITIIMNMNMIIPISILSQKILQIQKISPKLLYTRVRGLNNEYRNQVFT